MPLSIQDLLWREIVSCSNTISLILFWTITGSGAEAFIYLLNTVVLPESKSRNFIHEQGLNQEPVEVRDGFHLVQNHKRQREFTQKITHGITTHLVLLWAGVSLFCAWLKLTWSHLMTVSSLPKKLIILAPCCTHMSAHLLACVQPPHNRDPKLTHAWLKSVRCTYIVLSITEI